MSDLDRTESLEVIELPNGRFAIRAIGAATMDANDEFATRQEAEAAMFQRMEAGDVGRDLDVIKPGQGQGL